MENKFVENVEVLVNEQLATNIFKLVLFAPKTSASIKPGQFVHLSVADAQSAMLRRPFSVFDRNQEKQTVTILYEVRGRGTALMKTWQPGFSSSVIAPLGNSWGCSDGYKKVLLIGAGLGAAPLFMFAKQLIFSSNCVDIVLGAASSNLLVTEDSYISLKPNNVAVSTDDGSKGFAGFCTIPAGEMINSRLYDYVATCGPYPVMREVARLCKENNTRCEVSMEGLMACGVGACKTCVVETVCGKKRSCADGPIFNAEDILW